MPFQRSRPRGVPRRAKERSIHTRIGYVRIWYWPQPSGKWNFAYDGQETEPDRGAGEATAWAAIAHAGRLAKWKYGKPTRRRGMGRRFEVLERDNFTCVYCGRYPPEVILEVDHLVPFSANGSDDLDNLVTACRECNNGKRARVLDLEVVA